MVILHLVVGTAVTVRAQFDGHICLRLRGCGAFSFFVVFVVAVVVNDVLLVAHCEFKLIVLVCVLDWASAAFYVCVRTQAGTGTCRVCVCVCGALCLGMRAGTPDVSPVRSPVWSTDCELAG